MDLISINSIIAEKGQNCDDQGESVLWLDSSEDGAGTGDRIDGAGIVGKARIDADGHVLSRAGAAVNPRPCAVPVPGRLRRGGQAEALEIGIGEARHGAAAVPAAGREMGLPEGVVVAQNGAVPAPVPGPGPVIEGGDVAQPGTAMGEAGDLRPFAGRRGEPSWTVRVSPVRGSVLTSRPHQPLARRMGSSSFRKVSKVVPSASARSMA